MMGEEKTAIVIDENDLDADDRLADEIEARNNGLLDIFAADLQSLMLSDKQIDDHRFNANTYVNLFLMTGENAPYNIQQGVDRIDDYFGYFFIRKCMWSSLENLPENVESVRLFYKSMMEHGKIEAEDYRKVERTVEDKLPEWCEYMRRWNEQY